LPEDPRSWDAGQVSWFAERATVDEIEQVTARLAALGGSEALTTLKAFLYARGGSTFEKRFPAVLGARALLALGPPGVAVLSDALTHGPRPRYGGTLLMMLWRASQGDFTPDAITEAAGIEVAELVPPAGTPEAARRALSDHAAEAVVNPQLLGDIGLWLQQTSIEHAGQEAQDLSAAGLLGLLAEGSIRLSPSLLDEFDSLISEDHPEETFQQHLARHPALLDPLAATVVPKLRLGTEYATDFALRRHDDRWLLVEIERPQDAIFTAANDFTARFTHAYGQVLDFQRWVDDNLAYARTTMPNVSVPTGLLVIGRRAELTNRQANKLAQLVSNSARIEVVTYDDLHSQARVVYSNLHRRA
jgi:hypothetical protein